MSDTSGDIQVTGCIEGQINGGIELRLRRWTPHTFGSQLSRAARTKLKETLVVYVGYQLNANEKSTSFPPVMSLSFKSM